MENNPNNIYFSLFVGVLIFLISLAFTIFIKSGNRKLRIIYWSGIVVYAALLPYTILALMFGYKYLKPSVINDIPVYLAILFCVSIFAICRDYRALLRKNNVFAILLGIGIYTAIFLLQKLPTKNIHIAQYFLLSFLILKAVKLDYNGRWAYVFMWCFTSLIGVMDETFQGIHNARFFNLYDALMNSSVSAGSALIFFAVGAHKRGDNESGKNEIFAVTFIKDLAPALFQKSNFNFNNISTLVVGVLSICNLEVLLGFSAANRESVLLKVYLTVISSCSLVAIALMLRSVIGGGLRGVISTGRFMLVLVPQVIFFSINATILAVILSATEFR